MVMANLPILDSRFFAGSRNLTDARNGLTDHLNLMAAALNSPNYTVGDGTTAASLIVSAPNTAGAFIEVNNATNDTGWRWTSRNNVADELRLDRRVGGGLTNAISVNAATGFIGLGSLADSTNRLTFSGTQRVIKQVSVAYLGGVIDGGMLIDTGLAAGSGSFGHCGITIRGDADNASFIYNIHNSSDDSALVLGSNNAERMRMDKFGNIGIGKTNPATELDVVGTTTLQDLFVTAMPSGATQGAAGAAAGQLWRTASHATLPDGVVLLGL